MGWTNFRRAKGTSGLDSDFDYIIGKSGGTSKQRKLAKRILPRGRAGGEVNPRSGRGTGIDLFNTNLDESLPCIKFLPKGKK